MEKAQHGDLTHTQSPMSFATSTQSESTDVVMSTEKASVLTLRCYKVAVCLWANIEAVLKENIQSEVFVTSHNITNEVKLYIETDDTNYLNPILDESNSNEEILIFPTTLQKYYCSAQNDEDYSNEYIRHLISQTLERHLLAKAQAVKREDCDESTVLRFPMYS
ncbi:hypothetical protein ABC382_00335 [Lysinibacillus sp. 1P01SD]|uniref:hypothetical protein n=1 Tax=Lysinibacillus sp. 1P01SD TaxID=3132285 RepID=UPI0039A046D6